ncbi:MAG: UDP-N-acetylmuramate--L-alanine ligase [Ruminococcus sp.]|nr:UDP-N-acetylmuramate--L-alanine ligase [Ruminococcus sp.]
MFDLDQRFVRDIDASHIHFIGIGGSGMYPLAQILHNAGFFLTGSDNNETETVEAVRAMGIKVFIGQRAENLAGADLIIYTAAVSDSNPELKAASESGVRILERSELLGILSGFFENTICVAGTHGKTTVTSMITEILIDGGIDASAVIGGKLPCIGGSGIFGKSDIFVVESCEFKDHFLKLSPDIAVILNIDEDHMDYFGTFDRLCQSFRNFAEKTSKVLIINGEDKNTVKTMENIDKNILTFGGNSSYNFYPENIQIINPLLTEFDIFKNKKLLCKLSLHVPGRHNIINAVAAAAAADFMEISPELIAKGLSNFRGAGRRFEKYGEAGGITVADDYAHHPAEISVTLDAALSMGYKRVWAVHQPFTFSRTKTLLDDFAKVLSKADIVLLTAIMGGREENIYDIHTRDLAGLIPGAKYFENEDHDENFALTVDYIAENALPGDLILTLGCGDINKVARKVTEKLKKKYL